MVPLLTQMYKWVLVQYGTGGAAEVTSIGSLSTLVPNALEPSETPLKGS